MRGMAPLSILMAVFMLAFSFWFGLAWGVVGWIVFGALVVLAIVFVVGGIRNVLDVRRLPHEKIVGNQRPRRLRILGVLIGITYALIVITPLVLGVGDAPQFILPAITFLVGAHFIPFGIVFGRRFDYLTAALAIASSAAAFMIALQPGASLYTVNAAAGIGGALATAAYGINALYAYRRAADEYLQSSSASKAQ